MQVLILLGKVSLAFMEAVRHPSRMPWREISANVYRTGAQALGITALVGFLIGVVLSYLSAQQLKAYGAGIFIVNLLGISVVRELGPVLAAILVAGRSGSAMTAQLGVMRVTEEIDAMSVMGIPYTLRLVLPRIIALAISLPLIVLWTNAIALVGVFALALVERAEHLLAQHVREADDGVQRRAQFVAHIGQELRFHAIGLFGADLGQMQLLLLDGVVAEDSQRTGERADFVLTGFVGDFAIEIAVGDDAHGVGHLRDRPHDAPHDIDRRERAENEENRNQRKRELEMPFGGRKLLVGMLACEIEGRVRHREDARTACSGQL